MRDAVFPYTTAAAFRAALKDRFTDIATTDTRYTVDELQRQFAYDRALARLFTSADADHWVLKGAGALLARLDTARHSKDIDVYFAEQQAEVPQAVNALRRALAADLGDFFAFDITRITALQEEAKGSRIHVHARLGPTAFAVFHIDVVVGTAMSGRPDLVEPLTPIKIVGLTRPRYRAFSVADHLADKLSAIISTHHRGGHVHGSSRVKDLVDIALIAATQPISGSALRHAIFTNTAHRGLTLPETFAIPDDAGWRTRYPRVAADAPGTMPTFDEAVAVAETLLNPVLAGRVPGTWNPTVANWQ
jgi:hypothetical protein